ncbi:transposase [Thalassospira tepidiphila]|uniref:transposase n=1 Tax=Thalassospira tepidiphila TaxID=393657 RepID=UPI003AA86436
MPHAGCLFLPNLLHHIVQRGHNRQTVFASPADYRHYLDILKEFSMNLDIKVDAFCLITNHVNLLLDSGSDSERFSFLMKTLAGRMSRYRNKLEGRSGTLWEGRFKSSPVQTDTYLLKCCPNVGIDASEKINLSPSLSPPFFQ